MRVKITQEGEKKMNGKHIEDVEVICFSDYCGGARQLLLECLRWMDEHPKARVCNLLYYEDESVNLTVYYKEKK